jgi:signal transduction histidine kinase
VPSHSAQIEVTEVTEHTRESRELCALVLAPTSKDASLACSLLDTAGVTCVSCADLPHLCREVERGAGVVLLPEDAVVRQDDGCLMRWLVQQPPWSDLPVIVLARPGADSTAVATAMDLLGNVTVLERPMRVAALVSAVRTALRARQRQYQIREHLTEHLRAQAALRESAQRKDEFLAILAHELRNPLAPIRNSLQILRLTRPLDSTAEHVAAVMDRQVDLMARLVDDLLEASRISRGMIELRLGAVDVAAVVHGAIETSRPVIEAGGHRLVLDLPPHPLTLEGDFVRLTQVVANLLNNAAKYSDPGGEIRIEAKRDGNAVSISVRDTGRGIPADMLSRVFELFMQVDRGNGQSQGGLGIGLTLAKTLVELHGGTLEARSGGAGQGSEFVVCLPLGAAHTPTRPPEEGVPSAVLASRRILVVDDNRDAAESLGTLLELLGADVRIAHNGPDALDSFAIHEPDAVVLDLGMPGMDGLEVARRIRQRPGAEDVTLIALTGWGQDEDRQRSQAAGFDHHLVKPTNFRALQKLLVDSA